jgi:hypothetical protein
VVGDNTNHGGKDTIDLTLVGIVANQFQVKYRHGGVVTNQFEFENSFLLIKL